MRPGSDAGDASTRGGIELRAPTDVLGDERAIEGLPIRLVIALVVGVAALSVMMTMIDDTSGLGTSELDANPDPAVIDLGVSGTETVDVQVVDDSGDPIEDATVILSGESATLDNGTRIETSDGDGEGTFQGVSPELETNQEQGTLEIDIRAPANSDLEDKRENSEILVIHS